MVKNRKNGGNREYHCERLGRWMNEVEAHLHNNGFSGKERRQRQCK